MDKLIVQNVLPQWFYSGILFLLLLLIVLITIYKM